LVGMTTNGVTQTVWLTSLVLSENLSNLDG
jgi:hypothetical protein